MLESSTPMIPASITSVLRHNPTILVVFPLVTMAVIWGLLLAVAGVKKGEDTKVWVRNHTALVVFWTMTPQVAAAYLCIVLHARYIGIYISACIAYMT